MRQAQLGALTILAITRAERAFFGARELLRTRSGRSSGGFIALLCRSLFASLEPATRFREPGKSPQRLINCT